MRHTDVIKRVLRYSKTQRIQRLIEISLKENPTALELLEMSTIQAIREQNGEIDKVKKERGES